MIIYDADMTRKAEAGVTSGSMYPLREFPGEQRRNISVVLTDIDDTLTYEGTLPAPAYTSLERLRDKGIRVAPVTGRPAGWCDLIARLWPVDGVVGENGAFYFRYLPEERRMIRHYALNEEQREINRKRLDAIRNRILEDVPGCRVAADQAYREADLAIDFAEDVAPLPEESIDRIVSIFHAGHAQAKVSSIHVNGWYGDYDKLSMTREFLSREFDMDVDRPDENREVVFAGDSPNDEPMFRFFRHSVGVANFTHFADRVRHRPRWLTERPGGFGFEELADVLLNGE